MDTPLYIKCEPEENVSDAHVKVKREPDCDHTESHLRDAYVGCVLPIKFEPNPRGCEKELYDNATENHGYNRESVSHQVRPESVNTTYAITVKLESEQDANTLVETTDTELQRPDIYYKQTFGNEEPQYAEARREESLLSQSACVLRTSCRAELSPRNYPKYSEYQDCHLKIRGSLLISHEHSRDEKVVKTSRNPKLACSICGILLSKISHLKIHMRTHTKEKPFECSMCKNKFSQKGSLTRHLRAHKDEKPFKCSICEKKFSESGKLTIHLRTHSGDKPFECKICGKRSSDKLSMSRHIRIHTGEKPYTCTVCTKKFVDSGGLSNHMRVHTGERPFECLICGKRLSKKVHLKSHMFIHTGETPFGCPNCGKKYTKKQDLKKHMAKHSEESL